jgi:voltage-gated potassium channel
MSGSEAFLVPPGGFTDDERAALRHQVGVMSLRVVAATALLLGAYAIMPVDWGASSWGAIPFMVAGLVLFTWIFARQLRKVYRADFPVMRAFEAVVFLVLFFLVLFAALAVILESQQPGTYSEHLNKVDGFYFAVTTLATVGYGDITPVSSTARVIVTIQMLGNVLLLYVAIRAIGQAVTRSRAAGGGAVRGQRAGRGSAD